MIAALFGLAGVMAFAGPSRADAPLVFADIAPTHSLVARVMEGVGRPHLLIPRDVDAASFELSAQDAARLSRASVVFAVGRVLSPGLSRPMAQLSRSVYFVELSEVPGLPLPGTIDETRQSQVLQRIDPHYWLNPEVAQHWLPVIADALAEQDPVNAETFRRNALRAAEELGGINKAIANRMRPLRELGYFVPNSSFTHFEHAYGLRRLALTQPDVLADLQDLDTLRAQGLVCIFLPPDALTSPLAEALTRRGVRIGGLDPLGAGLELGPNLYPRLIGRAAESFVRCLGGDGPGVAD
ncbi:MAG: zinc ABC transporter substrate-binding protein [Pseudomonadota bacterium]